MRKALSPVPAHQAFFPEHVIATAPVPDLHAAAETHVCSAIAALGRLAGIDVDRGDGPEDIDATLIQAAYECNFDDPQFLGGPGCFSTAQLAGTGADTVAVLAARTGVVTRGLLRYIRRRASPDRLREAQACVAVVEDTLQSLTSPANGH